MYFDGDQALFADFPKHDPQPRTIARADLSHENMVPALPIDEKIVAQQNGRFLLSREPAGRGGLPVAWTGRVGRIASDGGEAQYKLDGLIFVIEGVGRTKSGGQSGLQAFGLISYDDGSGTYHLRTFNDGRFLETTVKLLEEGRGMRWGFALGEIRTNSVLRINERGEWTEVGEISIGTQPAKKFWELTVQQQK